MAMQLPPGTDVWQVPAAPDPSGAAPNLSNPATNENIAVVTLSMFIAIATLFVAMRLYVQLCITHTRPWWDDFFLVLALPPQIAYTGITIWMAKAGLIARHIWETPLGVVLYELPYWTVVVAALPQAITGLVKLSLLLLYFRIFKPNLLVRYCIIFGMVIVIIMYIVWMFVFIFQAVFNDQVGSHLSWAQAAFNIATDVYIFVLPISTVARLHLSPKRKIGILFIFSTGLVPIVMSCLTLYWRLGYDGGNSDPTWTATVRMTVPTLEIDIGMMCACMPLFAPYFTKKGILSNWAGYIRSMRTRLVRSDPDTQNSTSRGPQYKFGTSSDGALVDSQGAYVELGERNPSTSSLRNRENGGPKEWFDATKTLTTNTVQDRNSKDASQLV